jgi:hypothetical protein
MRKLELIAEHAEILIVGDQDSAFGPGDLQHLTIRDRSSVIQGYGCDVVPLIAEAID